MAIKFEPYIVFVRTEPKPSPEMIEEMERMIKEYRRSAENEKGETYG